MIQRLTQWRLRPGLILQTIFPGQTLEKKLMASGIAMAPDAMITTMQAGISLTVYSLFVLVLIGVKLSIAFVIFFTAIAVIIALPLWIMRRATTRRNSRFQRDMPYFLDMLSMCITAGMNIEEAFSYVASRLQNLIGATLARCESMRRFGVPFEAYLAKLQEMITIPEFRNLCDSLIQGRKLGVSISRTLDIQSELIRTRRKQRAEELSRTATVKISLPLVFCIFPALLIIFIGPGLLQFFH